MKEVIVNRIKIKCSKGRIEKDETVVLPDEEVAKIQSFRPDSITILRDVEPAAKPAKTNGVKVAKKPTKRSINVKSSALN